MKRKISMISIKTLIDSDKILMAFASIENANKIRIAPYSESKP